MNASVYPFILGEHRQIVAMKTKETALRRKKDKSVVLLLTLSCVSSGARLNFNHTKLFFFCKFRLLLFFFVVLSVSLCVFVC